ncbi:MAG: hypothetical protein Q8O93_02260 [bacterium]|nr:hypothetical protein [bacterium]
MELKETIKEIIAEIEKKGDVKAVFGEPVKEGNIIIIPVACVFVAGAGAAGAQNGDTPEEMMKKIKGKGFGLGYKKLARPVGYIKIENGQVKFEPITDWQKILMIAVPVFGLSLVLLMKTMMKMKMRYWERRAA